MTTACEQTGLFRVILHVLIFVSFVLFFFKSNVKRNGGIECLVNRRTVVVGIEPSTFMLVGWYDTNIATQTPKIGSKTLTSISFTKKYLF